MTSFSILDWAWRALDRWADTLNKKEHNRNG